MGDSVEVHMLYDLLISPRVIYFVPRRGVAWLWRNYAATLRFGNKWQGEPSLPKAKRSYAAIEPYSRPSTLQVRENLALS